MALSPHIVSLAILKVNFDVHRKDYLETFTPLALESVRVLNRDVFAAVDLQAQLKSQFGLQVPIYGAKKILSRLKARGYIEKVAGSTSGEYRLRPGSLEGFDFRRVQDQVLAMHRALLLDLMNFCTRTFNLTWTEDEAESALEAYLGTNQAFFLGLEEAQAGSEVSVSKGERFAVARFIRHLQLTESESLRYLEIVVQGYMLANAIFLPEPGGVSKRFRTTEVFLDSGLVLDLLGYENENLAAPSRELVELLRQYDATLRCFVDTAEEVKDILNACAYKMYQGQATDSPGRTHNLVREFRTRGMTATDVWLCVKHVEADLLRTGVQVVGRPKYQREATIDEAKLQQMIRSIGYSNDRALLHDVKVAAAVLMQRHNIVPRGVEDCRALFVTTNSSLAEKVAGFCAEEGYPKWPPAVITDYTLTNLLWLKNPQAPDLPMRRLAASCYAALQPDDRTWAKVREEAEKLERRGQISAADLSLFRSDLIGIKGFVMDETLGGEEEPDETTVRAVIERIKQEGRDEALVEVAPRIEEAEAAAKFAQSQAGETRAEADGLRAQDQIKEENLRARCQLWAGRICTGLYWLVAGLTVIGGYLCFPRVTWMSLAPVSMWVMMGVVSMMTPLRAVRDRLEVTISVWLEELVRHFWSSMTAPIEKTRKVA